MQRLVQFSAHLWDVLIVVVVTFVAIDGPLWLVVGEPTSINLIQIDWLLTGILSLDVLRNWKCPASASGRFTSLRAASSTSRPSVWLWIDIIAALPYGMVSSLPFLEELRLVKLLRVARLMRQWQHNSLHNTHIIRLGFFIYWLGLVSHWLACGWLALGGITEQADGRRQYIRALYWCITTLTTVGYGDITPSTSAQTVYTMSVMILGIGVYGYVIGNVTTLLANLDLTTNHYREIMERVTAFMQYRRLPTNLQHRIRDYYAYLWANRLGYDESTVLTELPTSLRTEVALFLRRDFIERAPLFRGASVDLIREVALELRPVVYMPGDYVFRSGQFGRHMYFISRGNVEIISSDEHILNTLHEGDFFGEIALLFSQPRTASVRATDYCDLYSLDKDTFDRILTHYPDFAAHIRQMAEARQPGRQETMDMPPDTPEEVP